MRLKVDNCCCMNLRTGSLIIAWIGIVAMGFILASNSIAFIGMFVTMANPPHEDPMMAIQTNKHPSQPNDLFASKAAYNNYIMQNLVSTTNIIPSFIVNILLISGIKKNNHYMLLPWVISDLVASGLFAGYTLVAVIGLTIVEPLLGLVIMLITMVAFAFAFWIWLIVYSLYQEMSEKSERVSQAAFIENGQMVTVSPYEALEKNIV